VQTILKTKNNGQLSTAAKASKLAQLKILQAASMTSVSRCPSMPPNSDVRADLEVDLYDVDVGQEGMQELNPLIPHTSSIKLKLSHNRATITN